MDREGRDMYPAMDQHHYNNNSNNSQAGLEVNSYNLPPKPAWGAESTVPYPDPATGTEKNGRRTILGLSVLVFWGLVVLLVVLLAGGIGGGVGAGLASRKSTCSR